eukprot:9424160-Pyramimonas_sp.AAC.1
MSCLPSCDWFSRGAYTAGPGRGHRGGRRRQGAQAQEDGLPARGGAATAAAGGPFRRHVPGGGCADNGGAHAVPRRLRAHARQGMRKAQP